jgi:hypothetical protein
MALDSVMAAEIFKRSFEDMRRQMNEVKAELGQIVLVGVIDPLKGIQEPVRGMAAITLVDPPPDAELRGLAMKVWMDALDAKFGGLMMEVWISMNPTPVPGGGIRRASQDPERTSALVGIFFDTEAKTTMAWNAAINDDTREVADAELIPGGPGTTFGGAIPDVVFGLIPPPTEFPDAESAEKFLTFLAEAGEVKEQMEQMIQNGEVGHDGP